MTDHMFPGTTPEMKALLVKRYYAQDDWIKSMNYLETQKAYFTGYKDDNMEKIIQQRREKFSDADKAVCEQSKLEYNKK